MTAISDFAVKQSEYNAEVSADLDAISTSISDLNAQIAALVASQGTVSPDDQAALDSLVAAGTALEVKADALAGKTPPTPPTA